MIASIGVSVSGLQAAGLRLANSANNVANMHSTSTRSNGEVRDEAYTPQDVVQSSIEPQGGVQAELRPRDPATVQLPDASHPQADENGLVEYPNVHLEEELVNEKIASYDFKANLKTFKAADTMIKNLLDITS